MSPLEIAAALLGFVNVALVVARSVWNYPFGILMVILYGVLFFETRLYSDALLQIFFLVVQLYGWVNWARSRAEAGEVRVRLLDADVRFWWLFGIVAAAAGWGWVMHRLTDAAAPWWDATIAMASVAAQILLARRFLENWLLWIFVDLLAIPLFWTRGLESAAILYVVFLVLSCIGLWQWWRALETTSAVSAAR